MGQLCRNYVIGKKEFKEPEATKTSELYMVSCEKIEHMQYITLNTVNSNTIHKAEVFSWRKYPSGNGFPDVDRQGPSVKESRATLTGYRHGIFPDGSSVRSLSRFLFGVVYVSSRQEKHSVTKTISCHSQKLSGSLVPNRYNQLCTFPWQFRIEAIVRENKLLILLLLIQ